MSATETTERAVPVWEYKKFIPKDFNSEASTPVEALLQAQAIILDEERWVKSEWYMNKHSEVDPDDPFCNDWKVCAAGAVAMVTIGSARKIKKIESEYDYETGHSTYVQRDIPEESQAWECKLDSEYSDDEVDYDDRVLYKQAVGFLQQGAAGLAGQWRWSSVPAFNDSYVTTRQDILLAFSKGIALAAREEGRTSA